MENDILVSICCLTYNHEAYIRDALESFIKQRTTFRFEILIHDDASTDTTPAIIYEYEKKYPELVKPIYQKENQHSKGIKISATIQYPRAQGKYIAMCEGDDFWLDENKLQKQVEYLETHPECSLVVHASKIVDVEKKEIDNSIPYNEERDVATEAIIEGGGAMFSTNSMIFRREYTKRFPDFYINAHIGDYPLTIYLSLCGKVHYFPDIMSAYRQGVPGSWSENEKKSLEQSLSNAIKMVELYNDLDQYTVFRYHKVIFKNCRKFEGLIRKKRIMLRFPKLYAIYRKLLRE